MLSFAELQQKEHLTIPEKIKVAGVVALLAAIAPMAYMQEQYGGRTLLESEIRAAAGLKKGDEA